MMRRSRCLLLAQALSPMILMAATAAPAQTAAPAPAAATTAENDAETIVVTGTIFRRTDLSTPSPVTVLTSETLAKAGITNITDAVRSVSADNSGSIPTAFTGGFGAGSSAVSLRGLTVNSTITLIDGLRTTNYPLADDGQRAFVDLNTIPFAAVERIEVLKDGASSTYGADAIGGVVNIIMRKQIVGVIGNLEGGITGRGDGASGRASFAIGHGDLKTDRYNVYVTGEYEHNAPIYARDRPFPLNTADLTSIGGDNNNPGAFIPQATNVAIVAPTTQNDPTNVLSGTGIPTGPFRVLNPAGCPAGYTPTTDGDNNGCEENFTSRYGQIQPDQTRYGFSIRGTVQLNDTTQAYATASYFENKVTALAGPASIRQSNPVSTRQIVLPVTLPNGQLNPNNPYGADGSPAAIYYTFGDIPSSSTYANHVLRGAAGANGTFGDNGTWQIDATAAHAWLDITQRGYLNIAALTDAVTNGTYNFVDPSQNTAAIRAALSPDVRTKATTDLDMIQGTVTKKLFDLPGGPLQLGVGGSIRFEKTNDPNQNASLTTLGLNAYTAVGSRTVSSAFFEVNAPVIPHLELNLSGRYDHYSDGYDRFSPKVGAKFAPIPEIALRGTYSRGFRAPSFAETNGSVIGYTTTTIPCSAAAQHGSTTAEDGTCSGGSAYTKAYAIGFNTAATPTIKPELSTSFTLGAVLQPAPWISLTVDYYNIKKTRVITGGPLSGDALDAYYNGTPLPDGYSVTLDSVDPAFPNAIRRVLYVNAPYANAAALKTQGLDVAIQVQARPADGVKLTSRLEVTDIFHYQFKPSADSDYQEYVGTQAPYITSSGAGTPKWRGSWQTSLEAGRTTVSATVYYVSGYYAVAIDQFGGSDCATSSTYQGSDPNFNCHVGSFTTVDLTASYRINDNFTIYGNLINLFDASAPLNAGNYAATNYNPTYTQAGAVGRLFRAGVNIKF